jgi:shikimate dehydrogenase
VRVGRAAVLGRPIAHSLSPVLHRAAYAALGLEWTYEAIDCGVAELRDVLAARADWAGFSCTMPLKRAVLEVAHEIGPSAARVGAANTLVPADGGWAAENTDAPGLAAALGEHGVRPGSVTILGAGGTAQAALAALPELGVHECVLLVRDPTRARDAAATAERVGVAIALATLDPPSPALGADLVVSTLPPRAADAVADRSWRDGQAVLDVVYEGWPTSVARYASAAGATVLSGAHLLLHQAARQVELMTGRAAPLAAMRTALRAVVPAGAL